MKYKTKKLIKCDTYDKEITTMKQKLSKLRKDIGNYLYYKLNLKYRKFMAKTAGSIDFGHPVDLDKLEISKDCTWNPKLQ
jgi:hypothetical protein